MCAYLKALYPCISCKEPTRVRSRREAEQIRCPGCEETARLEGCVNLQDWQRIRHMERATKATDESQRLAAWFEAGAAACEVARYAVLAASRQHEILKKGNLGRIAESRREWAENLMRKLAQPLGEERSGWTGHLTVIPLPHVDVGVVTISIGNNESPT